MSYLNLKKQTDDGLQIARWAAVSSDGTLTVKEGALPYQMSNSDGTGLPLLKDGKFGADIIHFAPGKGVMNHTHEGAHILIVIKGVGLVEYNGIDYPLEPGVCYLIPGDMDHAIKAETELMMIAVGNDHRPVDSVERMQPTSK